MGSAAGEAVLGWGVSGRLTEGARLLLGRDTAELDTVEHWTLTLGKSVPLQMCVLRVT